MKTDHRSWPVPNRKWLAKQVWTNLLFAHWPIDVVLLKPYIPKFLSLDHYDGYAWLGIVPFTNNLLRLRYLPKIPFMNYFHEVNIRTYVTCNQVPGVYFFSLNIANLPTVALSRALTRANYFYTDVNLVENSLQNNLQYKDIKDHVSFQCHGLGKREKLNISGHYHPNSEVFLAKPQSLVHWLTERYCFFGIKEGKVYQTEILHEPWRLQTANLHLESCEAEEYINFQINHEKPLLHFSKYNEVLVWSTERVQ